jgi:hypothetical protein
MKNENCRSTTTTTTTTTTRIAIFAIKMLKK